MKNYLNFILRRMREPSTLAGLSSLAIVFGVPTDTIDAAAKIVAAIVAVGAVMVPERHE